MNIINRDIDGGNPCQCLIVPFLENELFDFSNITGFSKDTVKSHAQIMPQNLVLQPGA